MYNPNYEFCDELDAPEILVVLNRTWWQEHYKEINAWLQGNSSLGYGNTMFWISEPADRTYFMLKWPQ